MLFKLLFTFKSCLLFISPYPNLLHFVFPYSVICEMVGSLPVLQLAGIHTAYTVYPAMILEGWFFIILFGYCSVPESLLGEEVVDLAIREIHGRRRQETVEQFNIQDAPAPIC